MLADLPEGTQARILAVLARIPRPMSSGDIAHEAGLDRHTVLSGLGHLFNAKKVQRSKAGGRRGAIGGKEREWRLPPAPKAQGEAA